MRYVLGVSAIVAAVGLSTTGSLAQANPSNARPTTRPTTRIGEQPVRARDAQSVARDRAKSADEIAKDKAAQADKAVREGAKDAQQTIDERAGAARQEKDTGATTRPARPAAAADADEVVSAMEREESKHRERVAKLEEVRDRLTEKGNTQAASRVDQALQKEDERYQKAMKRLESRDQEGGKKFKEKMKKVKEQDAEQGSGKIKDKENDDGKAGGGRGRDKK